jgi:hypothetical protein
MSPQRSSEELPEERRMEIYQALADEQDLYEFTAEQARKRVAGRFGISEARLWEIEREGREKLWPPF